MILALDALSLMAPTTLNTAVLNELSNRTDIRESDTLSGKHPEYPMTLLNLTTERFIPERGFKVTVQVPDQHAKTITEEILKQTNLQYGDYDRVTFKTAAGVQHFRSLGSGRNAATETVVEVPCVELSFFLANDEALVARVLETIYAAHPYEEPVVFVEACLRTRHIRGLDEDNPNRFWNSAPADWVPDEHR